MSRILYYGSLSQDGVSLFLKLNMLKDLIATFNTTSEKSIIVAQSNIKYRECEVV